MDEARLTEISECMCYERSTCCDCHHELIAEVRRLRALLDENRARWFDGKSPLRSTTTWKNGMGASVD